MEKCPCSSQKNYVDCCGLFLEGKAKAATAEQLMRSRYTAHVKQNIDYILCTVYPSSRDKSSDRESVKKWAQTANWIRLEVLKSQKGGAFDKKGKVLFKAYYKLGNTMKIHSENSNFIKENGEWFYLPSDPVKTKISPSPKLKRNDPCHCGSGIKFKKCCGKKN